MSIQSSMTITVPVEIQRLGGCVVLKGNHKNSDCQDVNTTVAHKGTNRNEKKSSVPGMGDGNPPVPLAH